jgi:hypothetical protein
MNKRQARAVSEALMAKWREQHPDAEWRTATLQSNPPAARQAQIAAPARDAPAQEAVI